MDDVFNELTLRRINEMPLIEATQIPPPGMQVFGLEFFVPINNPIFVGHYVAWIGIGDFGFYRYGAVIAGLAPKHDGGRAATGATLQ